MYSDDFKDLVRRYINTAKKEDLIEFKIMIDEKLISEIIIKTYKGNGKDE